MNKKEVILMSEKIKNNFLLFLKLKKPLHDYVLIHHDDIITLFNEHTLIKNLVNNFLSGLDLTACNICFNKYEIGTICDCRQDYVINVLIKCQIMSISNVFFVENKQKFLEIVVLD